MTGWTEERCDALRKLWGEGLSASQIAAELGGITRNAVIGKVHRLGLSERPHRWRATAATAQKPRQPRPRSLAINRPPSQRQALQAFEAAPEFEPAPVIDCRRVSFDELTGETCRWPVGDPGHSDFFYCGSPILTGLPYCSGHCCVAFRPAQPRRYQPRGGRLWSSYESTRQSPSAYRVGRFQSA